MVPPFSLTSLKIRTYYQNEPRFIQVVIYQKINEYDKTRTYWVAHVKNNEGSYFDNSGVEHIAKEIKNS